jgi:hypothetical protein
MTAFWDIAPCSLIEVLPLFRDVYCFHHHRPGDWGSTHLWNISLLQWDYILLYPRRPSSSYLCPSEPEISPTLISHSSFSALQYVCYYFRFFFA